jgi:hypothetical protein
MAWPIHHLVRWVDDFPIEKSIYNIGFQIAMFDQREGQLQFTLYLYYLPSSLLVKYHHDPHFIIAAQSISIKPIVI